MAGSTTPFAAALERIHPRRVTPAFVFALAVILLVGGLSWRSVDALLATNSLVGRTNSVIEHIQSLAMLPVTAPCCTRRSSETARPLSVFPDQCPAIVPSMSAKDISFARRTETLEGYLSRYWFWGQRDKLYPDDPVEQNYEMCYPDKTVDGRVSARGNPGARSNGEAFAGVADEMIARRHEKQVLDALDDLSKYLRGLREERKAVITITGGWILFRPNPNLTRNGRIDPEQPGVGPDGKLHGDYRPNEIGLSHRECERDRMQKIGRKKPSLRSRTRAVHQEMTGLLSGRSVWWRTECGRQPAYPDCLILYLSKTRR